VQLHEAAPAASNPAAKGLAARSSSPRNFTAARATCRGGSRTLHVHDSRRALARAVPCTCTNRAVQLHESTDRIEPRRRRHAPAS